MIARPSDRRRRKTHAGDNGSQLRVAGLTDEMTRSSFSPECDWIVFGVDDWEAVLDTNHPHLLLVESAWQGNDGSWQYRVGSYDYEVSHGLPDLRRLLGWARGRGIPTVFWNKEDPVHFDLFAQAASLFDVVLTSDSDRIGAYQALPGIAASVVSSLPFGAQPLLHNPIEIFDERVAGACFAGTYYGTRHETRRAQLEMILDGARQSRLRIYDRMSDSGSPAFTYPERFQTYVTGSVPYGEIIRLYRRFKVFLNTNSVSESPTMFSRRVFELLASGTPVVSTPSVGMEEMFGDIVEIVRTSQEAAEAIDRLLADDDHWSAVSTAGVRRVLGSHTYRHRLQTICEAAGVPFHVAYPDDLAVFPLDPTTALMESISGQSRQPTQVVVGNDREVEELDAWSKALNGIALVAAGGVDLVSRARAASPSEVVVLGGSRPPPKHVLEDLMLSRRFLPDTVTAAALETRHERRLTADLDRGAILLARQALADSEWGTVDEVLNAVESAPLTGYGMRRDAGGWPTL